jgi:hypothetical protein
MQRATLPVTLGLALFLALAPTGHAESEFQFHMPPGWVNLMDPTFVANNVPQNLMHEALSGKYLMYAIDPESVTAVGANASLNVIENPQTGRITEEVIRKAAAEMPAKAPAGMTFEVTDTKIIKLGDVDIGVIALTLKTPRGSMRMLQYAIPGKTRSVLMTYGCMIDDFDRYRPIFESSALATTGAYNHARIDWMQAFFVGAMTALLLAMLSVAKRWTAKAKGEPLEQAASPMPPPAPAGLAWDCPSCKRRVPIRIQECRCGAVRPT